jgi:hypothetical protein
MVGFIYKLTSPNGKIYIGQTKRRIEERFRSYQRLKGTNPYFTNALNKYGFENVNLFMLSDYLDKSFLHNQTKSFPRKNIVLYNPKKGYEFTSKLISKSSTSINWVPIINLSPVQVKDLLLTSKVYVDFGMHPGKDRFPREAAVCGCCIITGRRGSANFYEDLPILDEFKFKDDESEIDLIIEKIENCLINYEFEVNKFKNYIDLISQQETLFENEISSIFTINS